MSGTDHSDRDDERRRYQRYDLWFPVTLTLDGGDGERWSICRDVSRSGMLVSARQELPIGSALTARFKIALSDNDERVVRAHVVWCTRNASDLGLVFPARVGLDFEQEIDLPDEVIEQAVPSKR